MRGPAHHGTEVHVAQKVVAHAVPPAVHGLCCVIALGVEQLDVIALGHILQRQLTPREELVEKPQPTGVLPRGPRPDITAQLVLERTLLHRAEQGGKNLQGNAFVLERELKMVAERRTRVVGVRVGDELALPFALHVLARDRRAGRELMRRQDREVVIRDDFRVSDGDAPRHSWTFSPQVRKTTRWPALRCKPQVALKKSIAGGL